MEWKTEINKTDETQNLVLKKTNKISISLANWTKKEGRKDTDLELKKVHQY